MTRTDLRCRWMLMLCTIQMAGFGPVCGQEIGLTVGGGLSWLREGNIKTYYGHKAVQTSPVATPVFGAYLNMPLGRKLEINIKAQYSERGGKIHGPEWYKFENVRLYYVEIPLTLHWYPKNSFFAGVGVNSAVEIDSRYSRKEHVYYARPRDNVHFEPVLTIGAVTHFVRKATWEIRYSQSSVKFAALDDDNEEHWTKITSRAIWVSVSIPWWIKP